MKIAIVILNWNGAALLEEFLPSVLQYSPEATVYVADNASTDNSLKLLQNKFPNVAIIQNRVNGGYAKGYNDALKDLKEDLFVLLNNDVAVTENWLQPFIQAFSEDNGIDNEFMAKLNFLSLNNSYKRPIYKDLIKEAAAKRKARQIENYEKNWIKL